MCSFLELIKENIFKLRGVINCMKKIWAWGVRNSNSIYTGCVVTLVMMSIMFFKDIQNTNKDIKRLGEMKQLLESHEKLIADHKAAVEFIDFQSLVLDNLKNKNEIQGVHLSHAVDMLSKQSLMLKSLIDYLKSIKEWPPKIDPPKPPNPDSLAKERSEAI